MARPFIEINGKRIRTDITKIQKVLNASVQEMQAALQTATENFGEFILSRSLPKTPKDTGALRASAGVTDGELTADGVVVFVFYNIVYAKIRDQGGIIRPFPPGRPGRSGKGKGKLFIPLRKGVVPGQPGLVFGKDFVLAAEAKQKGNQYLSGTLQQVQPQASQLIGQEVFRILTENLESAE